MTITTTKLTRAAGLAAVAGGLLFIAVQINHPHLDAAFATTTEYAVRETMKIVDGRPVGHRHHRHLPAPGQADRSARPARVPAVRGRLPRHSEHPGRRACSSFRPSRPAQPGYVNDVLAVAAGGTATGDIGALAAFIRIGGFTFLAGGLLFGIALFRAHVLPRWAAALLAVGSVAIAHDPPAAADQPTAVRHPCRRCRGVPRLLRCGASSAPGPFDP